MTFSLPCTHLPLARRELVRVITSSGSVQIRNRCLDCRAIGNHNHPHAEHPNMDSYPVVQNYTTWAPKCERCGSSGTELHHWAPRALFDDCELWPKSYLCRPCHRRWHTTATPGLVKESAA